MREVKYVSYSELKNAYNYVTSFLEEKRGKKITSIQTTISGDLGFDGDDNYFLLEDFILKNNLNHDSFTYKEYFLDEGEICNPVFLLKNILILIIRMPLFFLNLITFKQLNLKYPEFTGEDRYVKDLNVKDLITWFLEKEFKTSNEIQYIY